MKSMVLGFCFLEGTHIQTTAIQYLWTEMGPCVAALFIISSSEMQRVCRAATAVPPPKQQTGSASPYWLSALVTDTGRQVIDSLHLPVMALRLRILNTAQEPMAMLNTHNDELRLHQNWANANHSVHLGNKDVQKTWPGTIPYNIIPQ